MTDTRVDPAGEFSVESLMENPRQATRERMIRNSLGATALVSVLISGLIVWSLFWEAWTFIVEVDWGSVWDIGWFPRRGIYDIKTLIVASFLVTGVAMAVATPLGLGAAVYLSEYARPGVRRTLKPILEILAGIPSVVLGFFALNWIAPNVVAKLFGGPSAGSLLAAGIGVGVLIIPLVASISEDAMKAVPMALREASSGLGARKVSTTVRVVLPAAISGLVASLIVAVSRALGETMVVFMAAGAAQTATYTHGVTDSSLTMTAGMASLARGTDNVVGEGLTFQSLFFVGLVLFVMTFALNLVADRFVQRVREQY
ncbi:phosphate ABC transporter permease subunit PstC [Candidatus Poriferisocius sp.]|uniref:phosphate ABC transporter permease subunit PstC n=1 Tax=Candidatus Poriferisocius sp. TaxID=3101276 RepID=UPI003B5CD74E